MSEEQRKGVGALLERLALRIAEWTGSTAAFVLAVVVIVAWAVTGPIFGFTDTWQLVINTGTTVVTFLMVFLIQRSQNKDTRAIELKLDEIVASLRGASNRLIAVEDLSEEEIEKLRERYRALAEATRGEADQHASRSVDEDRKAGDASAGEARG